MTEMKKIIAASVLGALLLVGATSCASRNPGKTDDTTTNLQDIFSKIDEEINNPTTIQIGEVLYKVYGDHAEVIGCNIAIGDIKIAADYDGKKVTAIADSAFSGFVSITSVEIPDSVTTIGEKAFMGCTQLSSIKLPASLTSIGSYAFYGCSLIESVELPAALNSLGDCAFSSCKSLKSVTVADGNSAFCAADGVLFSADKSTLVFYPNGKEDTSYTIPETVKTVSDFAFSDVYRLESVSMSGVTSLGDYTFRGCTALKNVELGSGLKFIGAGTFRRCSALTSIVIPEGVVSIGYLDDGNECGASFCDCTSLTTISLPSTLKNVYRLSFDGCTALNRVEYNGTKQEWSSVVIGEDNVPLKNAGIVEKTAG